MPGSCHGYGGIGGAVLSVEPKASWRQASRRRRGIIGDCGVQLEWNVASMRMLGLVWRLLPMIIVLGGGGRS